MASGIDDFNRANGALGSPWVTKANYLTAINGIIDITSNRVRIKHPNLAYYGVTAIYGDVTNFDVTLTFTLPATKVEQYPGIAYRMQAGVSDQSDEWSRYGQPWNGYQLILDANGNVFYKSRYDAGVEVAATARSFPFTFTGGSSYKMRVRVIGDTHKAALWLASSSQVDWQHEFVDTTYSANLRYGFSNGGNSSAAEIYADDWVWDNAPTIVPGEYVQEIGTAVSNTNGTTLGVTFSGTNKPVIGDLIVVWCTRDNLASDPLTGDSFTDNEGNTYTRVPVGNNLTTQADGLVSLAFYSILTSDWTGTQTLTWTLPSRVGKVMAIDHYYKIGSVRECVSGSSTAGAPSVTSTVPVAGDICIGCASFEHSTASTITSDTDTTNGYWSGPTTQLASGGTTLAGVKLMRQRKIASATGSQTFNTTNSVTASVSAIAMLLVAVPGTVSNDVNASLARLDGVGSLPVEVPNVAMLSSALNGVGAQPAIVPKVAMPSSAMVGTGSLLVPTTSISANAPSGLLTGLGSLPTEVPKLTANSSVIDGIGSLPIPVSKLTANQNVLTGIGTLVSMVPNLRAPLASLLAIGEIKTPSSSGDVITSLLVVQSFGSIGNLTPSLRAALSLSTAVGAMPLASGASAIAAGSSTVTGQGSLPPLASAGVGNGVLSILTAIGSKPNVLGQIDISAGLTKLSGIGVIGSSVGSEVVLANANRLDGTGQIRVPVASISAFAQLARMNAVGQIRPIGLSAPQSANLNVLTGIGSIPLVIVGAGAFELPFIIESSFASYWSIGLVIAEVPIIGTEDFYVITMTIEPFTEIEMEKGLGWISTKMYP